MNRKTRRRLIRLKRNRKLWRIWKRNQGSCHQFVEEIHWTIPK